jgi:hypothetical protein
VADAESDSRVAEQARSREPALGRDLAPRGAQRLRARDAVAAGILYGHAKEYVELSQKLNEISRARGRSELFETISEIA